MLLSDFARTRGAKDKTKRKSRKNIVKGIAKGLLAGGIGVATIPLTTKLLYKTAKTIDAGTASAKKIGKIIEREKLAMDAQRAVRKYKKSQGGAQNQIKKFKRKGRDFYSLYDYANFARTLGAKDKKKRKSKKN